jgi:hypothetical protein
MGTKQLQNIGAKNLVGIGLLLNCAYLDRTKTF